MSQQNVDVVVRVTRRFNELGVQEGTSEDFDPEVEFDWSNSDAPDGAVYHGLAEWRAVMQSRTEDPTEQRFDVLEITDAPADNLIVVVRVRGRGRASGIEVEARSVTVWTLEKGKVSRVKLYRTRAEALDAAGLEA
jgi:ketosteroid isomerase-like protein